MSATETDEIHGIQVLRGIAALAVVVHHALEMSNGSPGQFSPDWLTTSGAVGVDIFFVISGFIMLHTAFRPSRPPLTPAAFLKRRFLRIYPFYWLCLIAMSAVFFLGFMKSHSISAGKIVQSALLLPNDPLINVSWTLSYEVFFYLLFAASLLSASRTMTALLSMVAIALTLGAGTLASVPFLANPVMLEFSFGIALALLVPKIPQGRAILVLGAVAAAAALLAPLAIPSVSTAGLDGWARVLAWGLPATAIVAASLSMRRPTGLAGRGMLLLGDASYALYLTHIFGIIAYGWLLKTTALGNLHQLLPVIAVSLLCTAGGVLAHLLVEAPLNRYLKGQPAFRKPGGALPARG